MAVNTYDEGDLVRCTGTFTDADDAAVDPTTVTFKFQDPSGNETSYVFGTDGEVVKDDTGIYHVDISTDEDGNWFYRWESTGTGQAAGENLFRVNDSRFD